MFVRIKAIALSAVTQEAPLTAADTSVAGNGYPAGGRFRNPRPANRQTASVTVTKRMGLTCAPTPPQTTCATPPISNASVADV